MLIKITKRWSAKVVFEAEVDSENRRIAMGLAIKLAIEKKVDLRGSNLSWSDLSCSDLSGSDLSGSDLSGSDLRGSNLSCSDLSGSDLSGSDLSCSDLSGSDLRGSNLSCSDLRGSNLSCSDLSGSDLSGSDLTPIKDDLWSMLSYTPREVPALIEALKSGTVNGSAYTDGKCGCLVGTLAIASGKDKLSALDCSFVNGLIGNASRPAERFFLSIRKGDTPETNQFSKLALEWCEDWFARMTSAFSPPASYESVVE